MDAKQQILEQVLTNQFDVDGYLKLCTELFNGLEVLSPHNPSEKVWSEYKFNIASFTNVGRYINGKEKTVILAVELQSGRSVERARSLQRNFVARLLSDSSYDAAIVAFFSADDERWRLSFVRLDYEFAAGRAKELLTPAKRYSYLVGKGEPCHTAMEQLFPIFRDEEYNPTLDKMEEAFSVERVTDDFFKKYKEKYFELKEFLDGNAVFIEESQLHQFTSEQFAKKLMGQLAFLYFLQKKGWLGVKVLPHIISDKQFKNAFYNHGKAAKEIIPKAYQQTGADEYHLRTDSLMDFTNDEADTLAGCFKAEPWGSGTKTFIRDLCTNCLKLENRNFFDDYLEPLFYEALNHRRGENNYYNRFNCKIPFLNGGLFEPLENYDWKNSKFGIPNELFSNRHNKGDREADGILDIFDRYNFTMNEDEPLEREVAVDPEMLGKIFENLLDTKDRKSKGAFYTPREIVHYMCQESLINYLVNETDIAYEDMKDFIFYGELMKDEDCGKHAANRHIPESVYGKLGTIDKALVNVKVADPAVGSGAFPLGMLSEIVKVRNNITAYYAQQAQNSVDKARIYDQRDPYKLKWQTIKNSIYAVDIEASAVDIAKLRLWLSIVVDENLEPSYEELRYDENVKQRDPHPLPNLDYNIMCGNSLIDEFEGIKLFDDSILNKETHDTTGGAPDWQLSLFSDSMDKLIEDLFKEQDRLFGEEDADRKYAIKKSIDKTIDEIIRAKLQRDGNAAGLTKYEESLKQKTKPYFLWKLEFARVFKEKSGFDIVIGNPPYLRIQGIQQAMPELAEAYHRNFISATGAFDLYVLFVENGLKLINSTGITNYIMPHKWVNSSFGKGLRQVISAGRHLRKMISFGSYQVFNASTYTSLLWITKSPNQKAKYYEFNYDIDNNIQLQNSLYNLHSSDFANIYTGDLSSSIWVLTSGNIEKVISKLKQQPYTIKDVFEKIFQGIATSKDSVYFLKDCIVLDNNSIQGFSDELQRTISIECGLVKPLLKGYQIHRYQHLSTNNYVIVPYKICNINGDKKAELYTENELSQLYPNGYAYLKECEDILRQREHGRLVNDDFWYRYIYPKNLNLFENEKIITPEISLGTNMIYDTGTFYHNTKAYSLVKKQCCKESYKYYLAILNSKVLWFYLQNTGYVLRGGYYTFKTNYLEPFPLPESPSDETVKFLENLVNNIIEWKIEEKDTSSLEKQIDQMVYKLYELTDDEIEIVEEA